eukprot:COSAG02_NODE_4133_length_5737_cov_4.247960_2_plen_133_part_00
MRPSFRSASQGILRCVQIVYSVLRSLLYLQSLGLRSLRKKVGADVLDEAWTKRRLAGAVADSGSFFPAQGLFWLITGDATYGEQQGPVSREDMAALMEMEAFWNEDPRLQIYYAENPAGWQPWTEARPNLNL